MILIAQSQWFENKDPNELLLIFGLFFVVLAFITLICWIFFAGDEGSGRGNRSSGGHSSRDGDYSNRSSGNYSSDGSGGSGQYSSSQTNFGASGMSEALEGYNQGGGSSSTSEVHGYSSTSSSSSMDINRNADFDYDSMPELNQISRSQAEAYFQDDIFNSYARWDDLFGVIYIVPPGPQEVDDLTAINGISHNFQRELHTIGIFMYKQIASWPNDTCRNISKELNSGDLLFRENWPQQARQLHHRKYGEEIAPA